MNQKQKDIAAKWVEALRSGRYEQGKNFLRARDERGVERFCCLGVLCDIIPGVTWLDPNDATEVKASFQNTYSAEDLPSALTTYVGLRSDLGNLDPERNGLREFGYYEGTLASLNDNSVSFARIADLIEAHPEAIFVDIPEPGDTGEPA